MVAYLLVLLACLCPVVMVTASVEAAAKETVGWVERVRLSPGNVTVDAKLDTGADCSSLGAANIVQFHRGGENWVRFEVLDRDGKKFTMERPLVRRIRIKQKLVDLKPDRRVVVRLGVCLGKLHREVDVNLVDRSRFAYGMLIGRNFMEGLLVDPNRKYTAEPDCPEQR